MSTATDDSGRPSSTASGAVPAPLPLDEARRDDPLTGLRNRRAFVERLDEEIERTRRQGSPVSLLMIDVDGFRSYNDTFGRIAGDDVLERLGGILEVACRTSDLAARYGGDEFAVILTEADDEEAEAFAERFRDRIEASAIGVRDITVSVGVATTAEHRGDLTSLITSADDALCQAKIAGPNGVRAA